MRQLWSAVLLITACHGAGNAGSDLPEYLVTGPIVLGIQSQAISPASQLPTSFADTVPGGQVLLNAVIADGQEKPAVEYSLLWVMCDPQGTNSTACDSSTFVNADVNTLLNTKAPGVTVSQMSNPIYTAPDDALDGLAPNSPQGLNGVQAIILLVLYTGEAGLTEPDTSNVIGVTLKRVNILDPSVTPNSNPQILQAASGGGVNALIQNGEPGFSIVNPVLATDRLVAQATARSAEEIENIAPDGAETPGRETLAFSWYINGGTFPAVPSWIPALTQDGSPIAIDAAGTFTIYLLLRDGRGGLDFQTFAVNEVQTPP